MAIAPAVAAAAISAAGSAVSSGASIAQRNSEVGANYQLWEEQRDYDYAKWLETNEYNSPSNQMRLMMGAGINPAAAAQAVTGQGAIAQGFEAPNMQQNPSAVGEVGKAFSPLANVGSAMIDNATKVNAMKVGEQQIEESAQRIENMKTQGLLNEAQAKQINTLTPIIAEKSMVEIMNAEQEFERLKAQTELLKSQKKQTEANTELTGEQIYQTRENTKTAKYKNVEEEWKKYFRETYNVNPESPWINNMITAILGGGDTAENLLTAFSETYGSLMNGVEKSETGSAIGNWMQKRSDKLTERSRPRTIKKYQDELDYYIKLMDETDRKSDEWVKYYEEAKQRSKMLERLTGKEPEW